MIEVRDKEVFYNLDIDWHGNLKRFCNLNDNNKYKKNNGRNFNISEFMDRYKIGRLMLNDDDFAVVQFVDNDKNMICAYFTNFKIENIADIEKNDKLEVLIY